MKTIRQRYQLFFLNAYSFGISFMWNAIHPVLLPLLILQIVPDAQKNTGLGLLTSIGLVVALIVQPISGAMSDATRHRWGRRRPWLLYGTLGDLAFLIVLALARNYWALAIGYIGLQFTSNLAHGANQGLIPDLIPVQKRGEAAGIKSAVEIVALVAASVIIGHMNRNAVPQQVTSLLVVAGVLGFSLLVTWLGVQENKSASTKQPSIQKLPLRESMRIDLKSNRDYVKLMAVRFLLFFGVYAVQAFALYYFQDVLQITDPARLASKVLSVVGVGVLVIAYPSGILLEKLGRKSISMIASALCAFGIALLLFVRGSTGVLIAGGALGTGLGIFYTVNWAWATSLVPAAEAGKYLGLSNLATAGSGAIARALGPIVDLGNRTAHNAGYYSLFLTALIAVLGSLWLTARMPETQAKPEDPFPVRNVFIAQ